MPTQDAIDQQRRRLEAHRATLAHYLDQVSLLGAAYTPPGVGAGIREARAGIAQCKAALHGWGVAVGDHPDDAATSPQPPTPTGTAELERALRVALPAESQAQAPGLARLLSALDTGVLSAEALRERLTADPSFAQVLRGLVGQQINLGGMAVSFGEGNQIGDVSIRDLAGRDIVTVNVYHGAPTPAPLPEPHPATPSERRKLRIFLCHSSADKAAVRRLSRLLAKGGAAPWLDEEQLIPGQDWRRAIPSVVESSDVALVCLSRDAVSREGYLRDEIAFALTVAERRPEGEIFLVPLLLEPCDVPARLARWHWVSLSEPQGVGRLLRALRARAAELGAVVPEVPADAWLVSPPAVAPPPAPLTPADIERRWRKALSAALRRQWAQAEPLLAAIAAADPGYRDVQARLAEARHQLGIQSFYADLRAMREADDWQAVMGGFQALEVRQPGFPDPEGLRAWGEARQRREERYDAALVAADGGDWGAAVSALEALLAEAPGDAEATELLGHARGEWEAQREVEARRAAEQERRRRRSLVTSVVDLVKAGRYNDALAQITEVAAQPDASGDAALVAARIAETAAVPFAERLRAAELAGKLGDPRFPVAVEQWRSEIARRGERVGSRAWGELPPPYWCYVSGGSYRIGGWVKDQGSATIALQSFWVARLLITVAQYAPFVAEGYGTGAERWWTPEGWQWKRTRTQPWGWDKLEYSGLNQPVIGITWYEATAFCAWLSERLDGTLPKDYVLRLPTEAEWEAAAAYDETEQRRNYPWGDEEPNLERAIYDEAKLGRPAPVGCCPAGVAACGALDLAGNVWELTASEYRAYPVGSHESQKDFTHGQTAWRGGGWAWNSSNARCGARAWYNLSYVLNLGFRVVLAPVFIADSR